MNTHALCFGRLAAILGCLHAFGCAAGAPAHAPARAPLAHEISTGQACVVIQRGASGDVADTRIAEQWPDANYGVSDATFAGHVGHGDRDVLLGFALAGIPERAVVTKATLTLHKGVCGGSGVEVHRVTAAWDERTTTWNSFAHAYENDVAAEFGAGIPGEPGAVTADVTSLVRGWLSGATPNHGVLLRRDAGNTAFSTSEATAPAERPHLEVCYTAPPT